MVLMGTLFSKCVLNNECSIKQISIRVIMRECHSLHGTRTMNVPRPCHQCHFYTCHSVSPVSDVLQFQHMPCTDVSYNVESVTLYLTEANERGGPTSTSLRLSEVEA